MDALNAILRLLLGQPRPVATPGGVWQSLSRWSAQWGRSVRLWGTLRRWLLACLLLLVGASFSSLAADGGGSASPRLQPRILGDWWSIARDPDLGALTTTNQQPVDFGLWQAADGTWQLWSCIRGTREPGHTRLFHRWEGASLTQSSWTPKGIVMQADVRFGESPGGLQAPYVFRDGERWVMFYGAWEHICSATSTDGKRFERVLDAGGEVTLFGEGTGNARDPMVIRIGEVWHCYYTAHVGKKGVDYCRTSRDLRQWSEPHVVAKGGQAGTGPYSAECPFVVEFAPGQFYLLRTQHYGKNAQTSVYFSRDPLDFGLDHDEGHFVCTLPVAAPEVIRCQGQWFLAALLPSLKGVQVCHLTWEKTAPTAPSPAVKDSASNVR